MKKNINIGGIIFHIEEGGYDKLKNFLEAKQRFAAGYNAPSVIMADLESTIAEVFLSKLKDGLQVVTLEDVEDVLKAEKGMSTFKTIKCTNRIYLL